jgi:threonine/homoserine/homoserine lactone efflux protein
VREWLERPRGDADPPLPKWMQAVDTFTAGRAVAVGVALAAVNPKHALLAVSAGATIAQAGLEGSDQALALAVFVVLATAGPAVPLAIYLGAGARAQDILADLRHWLVRNDAAIIAVLLLVIGAKVIGDGIAGL